MNVGTIAGRLKDYIDNWKEITSDKFVLNCVRGYKIEFFKNVKQCKEPIINLSLAEVNNIEKIIDKLLQKGAIERCKPSQHQFLSSYFLVPKPNGSFRFILNLKKLNKFIRTTHFKLEDTRTAAKLIFPGYFMCKVDLQDAYYLVPIHPSSRKFLRFRFSEQIYQFTCLPFGLSVSPFIFTKLIKPITNTLRLNGFTSTVYLDDFLCIAKNYEKCMHNVEATLGLLTRLGFIINKNKSCLTPNTRCNFLGMIIDSVKYTLELPESKKQNLIIILNQLLKKKQCKISEFAQVIGRLVAACPAVEYGFVHTKSLEREKTKALIANNYNYCEIMFIPKSVLPDLKWWIAKLPLAENCFKTGEFVVEIFSDASDAGWGATDGSANIFGFCPC